MMTVADRAAAVTKLHDPVSGHDTAIFGATNGSGIYRGPWVVQIAAAKSEFLYVEIGAASGGGSNTLRAIAADGKVYFGPQHSGGSASLCIKVPVTGWVTYFVDIEGDSEQRFSFSYNRNACHTLEDQPH
jgi:hypothetical protein